MACPAILTGEQFLTRVLGNIDCQAQIIGTYGWQALGQPGSLASIVMTGLLTIFVALFGFRLLFGPPPGARDLVVDILKVGIVLTLAFSWPAFRTVVHDVVLEGPAEIAAQVGTGVMPGEGASFGQAMQSVDNSLLRLTESGTGRTTGQLLDREAPGGTFRSVAIEDESGFGYARLFWLAGIIGSLALLRLLAGLLLALAPLAAGFLLFEATRGLFTGWLRGLALCLVGVVAVSVVIAAELAILGPLLTDALRLRGLGYATPSAPTEILALTLAFAVVQFAIIGIMARLAYTRGWMSLPKIELPSMQASQPALAASGASTSSVTASRSEQLADSVETQLRRERGPNGDRSEIRAVGGSRVQASSPAAEDATIYADRGDRLGSSWRRTAYRSSTAGQRRDRGS